jgi:hypothetical protein
MGMPAALRPKAVIEVPLKRPREEAAQVVETPKSANEEMMCMLGLGHRTAAALKEESSKQQQAAQISALTAEIQLRTDEASRLRVSLALVGLRKWATAEYDAKRPFNRHNVNSLLTDGTVTAMMGPLLARPGPPPALTPDDMQEIAEAFKTMELKRQEERQRQERRLIASDAWAAGQAQEREDGTALVNLVNLKERHRHGTH